MWWLLAGLAYYAIAELFTDTSPGKAAMGLCVRRVDTSPPYTAVGLRLSFSPNDDGITFGTNHKAGLCMAFVEKIPKVIGFRDHSSLWVSVADPDGLAAALGV